MPKNPDAPITYGSLIAKGIDPSDAVDILGKMTVYKQITGDEEFFEGDQVARLKNMEESLEKHGITLKKLI